MTSLLSTTDLFIFFGSLLAVMLFGLFAGRKDTGTEGYFLAGKDARWWGVAGSIFGSNVSANHIAGMMGVGFAVGFAQSQFEITAIAGLLLLCYGFLPVYRKMNVYTLSEYLGKRYDDRSRVAFALVMIVIMVVVQMVPGFYFGSRSVNRLLQGDTGQKAVAEAVLNEDGQLTEVKVLNGGEQYGSQPRIMINGEVTNIAQIEINEGKIKNISLNDEKSVLSFVHQDPPTITFDGGSLRNSKLSPGDVDPDNYRLGILIMALVTGAYVIVGGLRAVIITDVVQSVLMLIGGLIVAFIVFDLPEVGGWSGMRAMDAAVPTDQEKMHLYEPSNHPKLPWTGMLSGLMILHFFYWGTNQFIVQRALAARSEREARIGIITAGFFKLLIPFFSIGTGIAAYYLFQKKGMSVASDDVFITLLTEYVRPVGFGLVGLVAAGLIGAILSSVDSMLNSASTIITFDVYKQFFRPDASEKDLVRFGRICIGIFIIAAGLIATLIMDPNSKSPFFLYVAQNQMKLVAGFVVAFLVGMFWKRATPTGGIVAILSGLFVSFWLSPPNAAPWESPYVLLFADVPSVTEHFGKQLNFFHASFIAAVISFALHIIVSLNTQPNKDKSKFTWTELGGHSPSVLRKAGIKIIISLSIFAILGLLMVNEQITPMSAGFLAGLVTWFMFIEVVMKNFFKSGKLSIIFSDDRFWGGMLGSFAIYMMYYYY